MAAVTVGLLGGAFDPPHVGHVALARARRRAVRHRPPARPGRRRAGAQGRRDGRRDAARSRAPRLRAARMRRGRARPVRPHGRLARGARARRPCLPARGGRVRRPPRAGRSPTASSSWRGWASRPGPASIASGWTPCSSGSPTPTASRSSSSSRTRSRRPRSARAWPRARRSPASSRPTSRRRSRGAGSTRRVADRGSAVHFAPTRPNGRHRPELSRARPPHRRSLRGEAGVRRRHPGYARGV